MKRLVSALLLFALASCAALNPEVQVRQRLEEAGFKPSMANCLAEKLVRKLDRDQLKELARVAKLPRKHPGRITLGELAERAQLIQDPKVVEVVTRAGIGCAIAG